jgi:hypothetical protein
MRGNQNTGRVSVFFVVIIVSLISSSCFKMNYSTTGASIPAEAKTYSVQYVQNRARIVEPGLNQQFTDDLKDYIRGNSNLIMINGTGDVDFEVVIETYDPNRPVTIVAGDEAAKNRFTISVKAKFTCNVNPELDFESSFSRYLDYSSTSNFESVKADLTAEILKLLIDDIYKRAFVNW